MKLQNKNLIKFLVPAVIGQASFFLFTIIDGIFVGNGVGENALGAINIVFPFVMTVNALYMLIAIGGITISSIRFGRGDKEGANQAFMHSVFLMLGLGVLMCVLGTTLARPIGYMLGANETYIGYASEYLLWYSVFIIPAALSILMQFFVRGDGSPILVMVATVASSCLNILLDWVFVFPLQMGVKGAAIATGISQSVCLIIILFHFFLRRGDLRIKKFTPSAKLFGKIFLRGAPETISQFTVPVATLCMNKVLLANIGELAVNSFSIISYVASFAVGIFLGVSQGAQPLFGQTYGEKNEKDLKHYFRVSAVVDLIGSALVYVVLLFVGNAISKMFGADPETAAYVAKTLPKYAWGFIFMALNTIVSTYMYSTKRTVPAVVLNIIRSFGFTTLITLVLPLIFGGEIAWFTFGIYEALSFILAVVLLKVSERKGIVYR